MLIPLFGSLVVMTLKNNPNLREFVSSSSSILLFLLVLSFIPSLKAGETLKYTLFQLLPGLSITLRADGFSMIFAMYKGVASSLSPQTSKVGAVISFKSGFKFSFTTLTKTFLIIPEVF